MLGDLVGERRRDDGHDGHRVLRHRTFLDAALANVVEQQHAHLIARDELVAAVGALHRDADAVSIRVRREHEVSLLLLGELEAFLECREDFRVRVAAGREVAIRVLLLRHDRDIRDADVLEHARDRHEARAVERRVDELEASRLREARADLAFLDGRVECILAVLADELDQAFLDTFRKAHVLGTRQHIRLLDGGVDDGGCVIRHLAAVRAVCLVAIVLCRIVRSRDHDAGVAVVIARRKAQGRHRHELFVEAHVDAVRREDTGSFAREVPALEAAVVADRDRLRAALRLDPVSDALRCLANDPDVHAVRAGAQHAAQTGRAELQSDGEAVLDGLVITGDVIELLVQIEVQ